MPVPKGESRRSLTVCLLATNWRRFWWSFVSAVIAQINKPARWWEVSVNLIATPDLDLPNSSQGSTSSMFPSVLHHLTPGQRGGDLLSFPTYCWFGFSAWKRSCGGGLVALMVQQSKAIPVTYMGAHSPKSLSARKLVHAWKSSVPIIGC